MKKLFLLLVVSCLLTVVSSLNAQTPQAFKYQAVVRDSLGNLITDQTVYFRISIVKGSPLGNTSYSEDQQIQTNQFGLASLNIGAGTALLGSIDAINWEEDKYFLVIEVKQTQEESYRLMGKTQLLSVPYALYALKAGTSGTSGKLQIPASFGQTLLNNGGAWIAVSNLYNDGTMVGIGTVNPVSILDVNGEISIRGNIFAKGDQTSKNTFLGMTQNIENTGTENTFVGYRSGNANSSGHMNVFSGYQAGNVNTTGNLNLFDGYNAGFYNTTGSYNCFVGPGAGSGNVDGTYNTCLGYNSNLDGHLTNATAIGYNAKVEKSNSLILGGKGSFAVNVGIGLSSPLAPLHLAVNGEGSGYYGLAITNIDYGSGGKTLTINQGTPGKLNFTEPGVADLMTLDFYYKRIGILNTSPKHILDISGGAYCNGTSWVNGSDSTLKRNIKTLGRYGLNEVMKMRSAEHIYKSDITNKHEIGFIAQEMKDVIPEVVFGEEGNMGISYGNIIPVLVNAIKELKNENDLLKTEVEKLKASMQ
jgi:hypothetical protein